LWLIFYKMVSPLRELEMIGKRSLCLILVQGTSTANIDEKFLKAIFRQPMIGSKLTPVLINFVEILLIAIVES